MIKETVWTIAENLSLSYRNGDQEATLLMNASKQGDCVSITLPEKALINLQSAIREALSSFSLESF